MQEKENLARQLLKLQQQCANDYLSSRLQAITSQEVIKEIISGFIAMNNQQFFQSISQTIYSVKQENKQIVEQIQKLKNGHKMEIEKLQVRLYESEELRQKIKAEWNSQLEEKLAQLRILNQQRQSEKQVFLKMLQEQKIAKTSIKQELAQKEQMISQIKSKMSQLSKQNNKLTLQVEMTKESGMKFKQSCQKILKDSNKQKEKQKQMLIEKINKQRQAMQHLIDQLKTEIKHKESEWQEKSYLEEQYKQQIIQSLKAEMVTISQQLSISQAQILNKVTQIEVLTGENLEMAGKIKLMSENIQKIQKQNEKIQLSSLYLQEENNYLRTEIISFDTRYKQLSVQKTNVQNSYQKYKSSINAELQQSKRALESLILEHKQTVQRITEQTSTSLKQITAELDFLKERESIYRQNENKLISRQQQIQSLLMNCQEQNKCMTQQLHLHFSDNQLHQNEIKLYEESIIKLNQQFRKEIQSRKQSYETSWRNLNEEMLEEKYRCSMLREQLEKVKEEISLYHQKQQVYQLYHQQIAQLKAQLALISQYQSQKIVFKGDLKSKIYFLISKANQQVKKLRKQNKYLRQSVFKQVNQHRYYMQQMFAVAVLKIRQQSLKCLFCQHQSSIKSTQKINNQQIMFKKTMPKLGNNQCMNYSNIKKALRSVNQRYQTLNQQNKHYTDHIDGVIGKI